MIQKIGSSKSVWIKYIHILSEQHSKKNTFVEKKTWIELSELAQIFMIQKIGSSKSVWIQYINIFPEQHSKKNTFVEKNELRHLVLIVFQWWS